VRSLENQSEIKKGLLSSRLPSCVSELMRSAGKRITFGSPRSPSLSLSLAPCDISPCANLCRSSYRVASSSRFWLREIGAEKITFTDLSSLSHPGLAAFLRVNPCCVSDPFSLRNAASWPSRENGVRHGQSPRVTTLRLRAAYST